MVKATILLDRKAKDTDCVQSYMGQFRKCVIKYQYLNFGSIMQRKLYTETRFVCVKVQMFTVTTTPIYIYQWQIHRIYVGQ